MPIAVGVVKNRPTYALSKSLNGDISGQGATGREKSAMNGRPIEMSYRNAF